MNSVGIIVIRLILLLFILLAMAILSDSQAPIHVSGAEGMALLKNLTGSSLSNTTNNSTNSTASNVTKKADDLWSWGSKPHAHTNPSQYDYLNDTGI